MSNLPDHTDIRWRNASSGQDTCVDIAHTLAHIRDSKNPRGPVLGVDAQRLLAAARDGRFG